MAIRFSFSRRWRAASCAAGLALLGLPPAACAGPQVELALLPLPQSVTPAAGEFSLSDRTAIVVPEGDAAANAAAQYLVDLLGRTRGLALKITRAPKTGSIRFTTAPGFQDEAYRLDVRPDGVTITASGHAGLLYGGVTLWQLATSDAGQAIPAVTIEDAPRFRWRGLMLDSARHFQSPAFVKNFVDWMAAHKLNTLHWHLVDDQGWRIEIKKYPRLTEVGAWRVPASAPGAPALPKTGGYYTQEDIREIVSYAAARGITIVPEIEMPGHALAPIRAYPELGMGVVPPPGIESDWGVFPYLYNIEDGTFGFLEDVLAEVIALFPSTYIHVGGDEAVKDQWRASPAIQVKMTQLGIKDEKALQSWFIGRIDTWLNARGRRLIGWDEILEGGLTPNATVMSWRGVDGAIAGARTGHDAVLAADPTLYFDHVQGVTSAEPPGRGKPTTLADVYAFDPSPDALTPGQQRHILGLQGNLWTEHVRTEARAVYMAFPRAAAVAELGWSPSSSHDFDGFVGRLLPHLDRLKALGLDAAPSAFAPVAQSRFDPATGVSVTLSNQTGADMRYTLDGSAPGARSPRYVRPLRLALPVRLRATSFRGDRALPGALDRSYDAARARRRDDTELKLCTEKLVLQLEDDAPAEGQRAAFLTDIMNPCWIYEAAPLDGVTEIAVDVGLIPFNFQIGADIEKIKFRPPATTDGEIEVRLDGCEGERIAVLPLAPAITNPALTTLRAAIAPRTGNHDLCVTYTATGPDPMWAVDAVQLVAK